MHSLRRVGLLGGWFGCVLLLLAACATLGAQTGDPKGTQPDIPKKTADKMKLPPGAIIVLVKDKDLADLSNLVPFGYLLTPEKYKELNDRIAQLEKLVKGDRKSPHACKLKAVVDGDSVRLTADLYFQTDQPRATVLLGFRGTQLQEAKLRTQGSGGPWQTPLIEQTTERDYVVQVEKPGDYQLVVEWRVPLASGGGAGPGTERSFDLALPGAAVTTLALFLPEPVRELRWNKTTEKAPVEQKRWEIAVGKITQLQVSWKEPVPSKFVGPLRSVRGQVAVRVEDNQILTTAELTLTDPGNKVEDWKFWLPVGAKVKVLTPEKLAAKALERLGSAQSQRWVLHLTAPVLEPIKLQITVVTPRPVAKFGVGPFSVDGALRQEGTIEVKVPVDARRGLRLIYHLLNGVEEREAPRDQAGNEVVALFKYWDMPAPVKDTGPATKVVSPLEIELKTVQGKVETQVEYALRIYPREPNAQIVATCKIVARPLDAPVDFLDIQLPRIAPDAYPLLLEPSAAGFPGGVPWAAWALASRLPLDGEWVLTSSSASAEPLYFPDAAARAQRKVRVRLNQAQAKEFTLTLLGTYTLPSGASKVHLELPRPAGVHDKGARGRIEVGDSLELLVQEGGHELPAPEKHQYVRTWDPAPSNEPQTWDLAWRPYRPEFAVTSTIDMTLHPKYAHVRQELSWDAAEGQFFGPSKTPFLRLNVPAEVKGLRVGSGGKLVQVDRDKAQPGADVLIDPAGKGILVLEYDFALPARRESFRVPLIWPEKATRVETKLRLWSLPGTIVTAAEASQAGLVWKDVGTEVVPGKDSLPVRVLQSEEMQAPLVLHIEAAPAPVADVVAERVLIQVVVDEDGTENYRARFLLTKILTNHLEIVMPVPLAQLAPQFLLDGKALTPQPLDNTGRIRLDVDPALYSKPVVLEVDYQLPRGQPAPEGLWHTTLNPPVLEGRVVVGKVRWQVSLPPGMLAVSARGDASTEQQWQWRFGLPSLEPASTTAELEQWLTGQESNDSTGEASLVSGAGSLQPLRIFRVSRAVWYLLCSGGLLLLGLAVYLAPPRPLGWLALAALGLVGIIAAAWLWPELLRSVLYGALPGGAVLVCLFAVQWTVHQRYKRQLVFMPGFTRLKAGSSLVRAGSGQRKREPSTIDAPLPPEKSNSGLSAKP